MTILANLTERMKTAMKARDAAMLSAVRMLVSAIKYAMVDSPEISEEGVVAVLAKEAKKRKEAALAYRAGNRPELAEKEEFELALIEEYLPKMMGEEEVREKVAKILAGAAVTNIGEAMKLVLPEFKGKADAGVVSKIVKEMLVQ